MPRSRAGADLHGDARRFQARGPERTATRTGPSTRMTAVPPTPSTPAGATELYDGIDNDCNPLTPDGANGAWLARRATAPTSTPAPTVFTPAPAARKPAPMTPRDRTATSATASTTTAMTARSTATNLRRRYDADGNRRVDGVDLSWFAPRVQPVATCANPQAQWWYVVDYNHDGCVDGDDLCYPGADLQGERPAAAASLVLT